jgi:hypothetical protein
MITTANDGTTTIVERRVCADCGHTFTLTEADIDFYLRRGLQIPRRCEPCRHERKRLIGARR